MRDFIRMEGNPIAQGPATLLGALEHNTTSVGGLTNNKNEETMREQRTESGAVQSHHTVT
jgi:hypothetical protein